MKKSCIKETKTEKQKRFIRILKPKSFQNLGFIKECCRLIQEIYDLEKEYQSAINGKEKEYLLSRLARKQEELDNVYAEEFLGEKYLIKGFKKESRQDLNLERLAIYNATGEKLTQDEVKKKRVHEKYKAVREENQQLVDELVVQAFAHNKMWRKYKSKKDYRMYKELMNSINALCAPVEFEYKPINYPIKKCEFKYLEYTDAVVKRLLKDWDVLNSNMKRYERYTEVYMDLIQAIKVTKFTPAQIRALNSYILNGKSEKRESKNLQMAVDRLVGTLNGSNEYRVDQDNYVVECNVNDVDIVE